MTEKRCRRLGAALIALVFGMAGLVLGPASPAAASVAALASVAPVTAPVNAPVTTNGLADCPGGYVCFWVDWHYEGPMGKLYGNNTNWSVFSQPECDRQNWEDCASSTFNNGNECAVNLYKDPGYGGEFLWEQRGSVRYNLNNNKDKYGRSFNDTISSNKWCP